MVQRSALRTTKARKERKNGSEKCPQNHESKKREEEWFREVLSKTIKAKKIEKK